MVRNSALKFALACATFAAAAVPAQATNYKVLHVFVPGARGTNPQGNLISVGGTLYGITYAGGIGCGSQGCGTVFSINPSTGAEHVVYSFKGGNDGSVPFDGLLNVGSTLYGTTSEGGTSDAGTVFSLDPTTGAEKVLYSFKNGSDGAFPEAALINVGGLLYGTTAGGGSANCQSGCGTVFSLNPATGTEQIIFSFPGSAGGNAPETSLAYFNGRLFGATTLGGTSANCNGGCGTIFSLNLETGEVRIVHSFQSGSDGAFPESSLVRAGPQLFGTTVAGGPLGNGTVYQLDAKVGTEEVIYSFQGGSDGSGPEASLTYANDTLFGTTFIGGIGGGNCGNGCGVIFALNPTTGTKQVVHAFNGSKGANPDGGLISLNGTLYGTTYYGGSKKTCTFSDHGCGTVFAYTP